MSAAQVYRMRVAPLAGLASLKELILGTTDISDISPLQMLTGLTRLELRQSHIGYMATSGVDQPEIE